MLSVDPRVWVQGRYYNWSVSLSLSFLQKWISLCPGASWLYIVTQNASRLYIWRVGIGFSWYLSHQGFARRFYIKVWAMWALFMIISSLTRLAKWLQYIQCGEDNCFFLPLSSLTCSVPSHPFSPSGWVMLPSPLTFDFLRLGWNP